MDIERKITKKHIIIGIASLVFAIGLVLIFTACNGGNSGKENTVVEETATITSTTTTATETTAETTTTAKVTTKTIETTTTESTTTEKITETTTSTKKVEEDVPATNDKPDEPEYVKTEKPVVNTTKATTTETKKTSVTTTVKPIETEKTEVTTQIPVSSSHYYGEICNNPTDSGWSRINGCWSYAENYGWYFSPIFSDSNAASWVESTGYMKPTYIPEVIEGSAVNVATWVWLQ